MYRSIRIFVLCSFVINIQAKLPKKFEKLNIQPQVAPETLAAKKVELASPACNQKTENMPATELPKSAELIRTIILKNNITPEMLKYTYFGFGYSPDSFSIMIDGAELNIGQERTITLPASCNTVDATFTYNFKNGYRTGTVTTTFDVSKIKDNTMNITFDWKSEPRLKLADSPAIKTTGQ